MSKRILIVEDEADIREAMADALTQQGYEVLQAENGQIGFDMALAEKPDLILLDIVMPIMGGHETLRRLRLDPWGQNAAVVIMSAMDDAPNVALAHQTGITEYLIKSNASLDELAKKVREVIMMQT